MSIDNSDRTVPARLPSSPEDLAPSTEEVYAFVAAMCLLVAGGIHLAVAPEHAAVSWPISTFFVVLGLGQLGLAASMRWRLPPVVLSGAIVVHLAVMTLYVASRTMDLPFVPPHDAGHEVSHLPVPGVVGDGVPVYPGSRIEPVGPLDLACLVVELVLVAMLVGLLPGRLRSVATWTAVALAVALVAGRVLV